MRHEAGIFNWKKKCCRETRDIIIRNKELLNKSEVGYILVKRNVEGALSAVNV